MDQATTYKNELDGRDFIKKDALAHYERLSSECCNFYTAVPKFIKGYTGVTNEEVVELMRLFMSVKDQFNDVDQQLFRRIIDKIDSGINFKE